MAATVTLSIPVSQGQHRHLTAAAERLGYPASRYAALLFEAAYAARIGQERESPPADRELDEQVRLVFALAGQASTAAIARATGVPEHRVVRILDAWKSFGGKTPPRTTRPSPARSSAANEANPPRPEAQAPRTSTNELGLTDNMELVFLAIADRVMAGQAEISLKVLERACGIAPGTLIHCRERLLDVGLITADVPPRGKRRATRFDLTEAARAHHAAMQEDA